MHVMTAFENPSSASILRTDATVRSNCELPGSETAFRLRDRVDMF